MASMFDPEINKFRFDIHIPDNSKTKLINLFGMPVQLCVDDTLSSGILRIMGKYNYVEITNIWLKEESKGGA